MIQKQRRARHATPLDAAAWTAFLRDRIGLDIASRRWVMCEPAIRRAMERVRIEDSDRFRAALDEDAAVFETLVDEVTVGETYFFRDPRQLAFLRSHVIPERVAQRGPATPLVIWSAGCATGEEPYSVAMLFDDMGLPLPRVVGTDLSRRRLDVAQRGVYGKWSLRGVPAAMVEKYFRPTEVRYEVADHIRRAVKFRALNLVTDLPEAAPVYGADVILCRNVLIYLEPAAVRQVVTHLVDALAIGGWLLLGPSDPPLTEMADRAGCEIVITDAGLAYRRRERRMGAAVPGADWPDDRRAPVSHAMPAPPPVFAVPEEPAVAREPATLPPPPAAPAAAPAPAPAESGRDAWLAEAVARLDARDDQAAADLARRYVDAGGTAAAGWVTLVRALANLGHERAALLACDTALEQQPACAELHVLRALLLAGLQRHEESAQAARRALYVDRGSIVAHLALGSAEAKSGNLVAARRAFAAALRALESMDGAEPVAASGGEPAGRLAAVARRQLAALAGRA